jgi:hypothetical protein
MSVPPLVLHLRVTSPRRRPVRLWLPLFLLWPLALVLGALALLVAAVADGVLFALGRRYHHYTALLLRSFEVLGETRGTAIRVDSEKATVDLTVR